MSWFSRKPEHDSKASALEVRELDVYYGRAHALQGVTLSLDHGVLAVVGRNGMGKTTLCNAITGLVGAKGSVRLFGEEILGLPAHTINGRGIGYVPQGRRVWPSLTVDEHLRLATQGNRGAWTVARIYATFPRLAERKGNGGAQLSGGEQQMLAISRALLFNPKLLVMDEPTEGLAPVIVQQVAAMLKTLAAEGDISVLLIEQNLGVAIDVADRIAVMVNGRIARELSSQELAADSALQHRLLGMRASGDSADESDDADSGNRSGATANNGDEHSGEVRSEKSGENGGDAAEVRIYTVRRSGDDLANEARTSEALISDTSSSGASSSLNEPRAVRGLNRWNSENPTAEAVNRSLQSPGPKDNLLGSKARLDAAEPSLMNASQALSEHSREARVLEFPVAATGKQAAYIAGTFDTKGRELLYLRSCIEKLGLRTVTVDLSTSGRPSSAMVHPREVARHHPRGERAVFTNDRGSAVAEMALAFEHFITGRRDVGGLISAGGSGGTALATAGMRRLAIGVPKVMVSTVASGDVRPYVGPSDICMMYSVTDVSGINRISERVLANAAHALAGMLAHAPALTQKSEESRKPAIGLSMFGVTTTCVQTVTKLLEDQYDCLVFHATGTGGQSMEKLVDSNLLNGVIDVTTTEVCDEIVGGVLSAGPERFDSFIRTRLPYVGSCGALDMVNFWAHDTVPAKFRARKLYKHNPNVTLMRTTVEESRRIGSFIVEKLNRMDGPVRFLIPDGGVSALDAPGQAFWDPDADRALFDTIVSGFRTSQQRKLIRLPHHLNDPQFADALVANFHELMRLRTPNARATTR
jgi:uncharacterized protein (UPF0261 family)/ABC-type branched-subunit amino acid transport system ATPase component